jgi:hypothetical protein
MLLITVSPCLFFGNTNVGIVSMLSSESESIIMPLSADVPVVAIAAAVIAAAEFAIFCCARMGVPGGILPDASVIALAALDGVILVTVVGSDVDAAWAAATPVLAYVVNGVAAAWRAASSSLRCRVYAALTCEWNASSKVAHMCAGIRKSMSLIEVGVWDVIVLIGVYWISRILLSSF